MDRVPENERMDRPEAADAYAQANFVDVNRAFVAAASGFMAGTPSGRILDLGSGPGDIPVALADAVQHHEIVGVDAAAEMLVWARRRVMSSAHAGRVTLVRGDAKLLPFRAGAFDAVVSNSILHHVANPLPFWREVARVVSRGGRVFMRDLMRPDSIEGAQALVDTYARDESDELRGEFIRSLCAAYTPHEVREQLRAAGLTTLVVQVSSDRHLDVVGQLDSADGSALV